MAKRITLFTFGYYGWGSTTRQLVEAVDAVEASRGFQPPMFVDIRISRSVRAAGFDGGAFGKLLGDDRYHWMKSLGNERITTKKGPWIKIAEPSAANELLELAVDEATRRRRILFFCGCQWSRWDGKIACHRATVAGLVLRAAKRRNRRIEIVEWPGGLKPRHFDVDLREAEFRKVKDGQMSIPLPKGFDLADSGSIPWGSIATVRCGDDKVHRLVGPAEFRRRMWRLPVVKFFYNASTPLADYRSEASVSRKRNGWEPAVS